MTRIAEESAVEMARLAGLSTVILRLAAIYGPGRGVRERLKAGSYKLIDDGEHYFSRVHVDDIVGILRAAAERAPGGAVYCVSDDRPTTQREYADWLVARLGVAPPPSVPSLAPGKPRRGVRNRKVVNARLKRELDYRFRYPSYVEGEAAIEAEEAGAPSVAPTPAPPLSMRRAAALHRCAAPARRSPLRGDRAPRRRRRQDGARHARARAGSTAGNRRRSYEELRGERGRLQAEELVERVLVRTLALGVVLGEDGLALRRAHRRPRRGDFFADASSLPFLPCAAAACFLPA